MNMFKEMEFKLRFVFTNINYYNKYSTFDILCIFKYDIHRVHFNNNN